ncbi:cell wall elongation regulator TseB-like domain-containing protein [Virgibacillus sp. W0430]|uniref:cell wall elongation regulator TseB-like domain-containing protein n=1 Tax=Virgibacillus sp. W0430 TaxID=3391580 RepID=UPI003F4864E9
MNLRTIKWVKWSALFVLLAIITGLTYFAYLYNEMIDIKTAGFSETEKKVINETKITEINDITAFYEKETYHIVFGTTNDEKEQVAFVPISNDGEILVLDERKLINQESILKKWENECSECTLIKIVPGMINNKPVWELTYTDKTHRYVFEYVSLFDGTPYEQFRFSTMFK